MNKVFLGGSRRIHHLTADVKRRLDRIIEKRLFVVIGDANGADKIMQSYLQVKDYDLVEVFCAGDSCRNNIGGWPTRLISTKGSRRDFSFYATKDRAMADEASFGLMLLDWQSVGTLMNVLRLIRRGRKVAAYLAPVQEFVELRSELEWQTLFARYPEDIRISVVRHSTAEKDDGDAVAAEPIQPSLL
jgi:adenine-specific DNA-methyltransferase